MSAEASPRPWHVGESISGTMSCIYDANGEHIASCFGMPTEADAAFIVDAVNLHEYLIEHNKLNAEKVCELIDERDRLRTELDVLQASYNELHSELADKARNYEDVIACQERTEKSLRDIVRRLLPLAETTVDNIRALGTARFPFLEQIKSDRLRGDINHEVANADHLLREARAAIGEEKE